ncbi:MAG: hypothetical protein ACEQSD_01445 [Flavobacteriales bacterium]
MSSQSQVIGCFSSQENLQNVFRSMIRVLCQFTRSGLKQDWVYSDHEPLDVYILDLDDQSNRDRLKDNPTQNTIIAISSHPEHLVGQKYALSKPLRSQSLLQVLQHIEGAKPHKNAVTLDTSSPSLPSVAARQDPVSAIVDPHTSQRVSRPTLSGSASSSPNVASSKIASHTVLYQLQTWPDLTHMSESLRLDAARVCALLAVRPATAEFISQFLGLSASEVERVLVAVRQCAHPTHTTVIEQASTQAAPSTERESVSKAGGTTSSLLSKLWNRLKGAA